MRKLLAGLLGALLAVAPAFGQQIIGGGSGGGGFVYTGVLSGIPATCTVGQTAFVTNATPGQNQYNCAATNSWTQNLNSGSGGASAALDNLASVSINAALLPQTGIDAGSTTKPFRNLFLFGAGTYGSTYLELTGTPTGNRVLTLPDVTGTLLYSGGALGTPASGVATNLTGTASGLTAGAATGNAGTATALATARSIYGNNFDGTAALGQVIASTYGGTGNGFAKLSGPATSEKTFTLPNASATILTDSAAVTVAQGGTGLASGTSGGVLAYTASGTLASSGALTANLPVIGGGAGVAPTVGTRSGNTTAYVTTTGTQTSGDCVKIDANGNHIANGSACGSATPGGSNTQLQFNNSSSFGGSANLTWVSPALTIGVAGSTTGGLKLTGSTSGTVTLQGQAAAGTYNFNLPVTAGTSTQVLTSGGGGSTAMTWSDFAALSGSLVDGGAFYSDGTNAKVGAALTSNSPVLGGGAAGGGPKTVAGLTTDGTSAYVAGVNATTAGKLKLFGGTSGDATVQTAAAAGTSTVVTLPNASSTLPIFGQQITFAGPTAARTVTFPDASFTAARTDAANTFTGVQSLTSPALAGTVTGNGTIPLSVLATQAADTAVVNASGSTASPTAVAIGSCSAASSALTYSTSSHAFGCNTISGSGTVNSGTSGQLAYYASSTTAVSGNANLTISGSDATLGVAGSAVGTLSFGNATSGTVKVAPPTGALGSAVVTLPNASSTLPIFGQQITFTGPTAARSIALPDAAFTVARTDAANTFTGTQTFGAVVGTTWNGNTWATGTGTLSIAAGKTATVSNTLTFTGTDSSSVAFGAGGTVAYTTTVASTAATATFVRAAVSATVMANLGGL